MRLLDSSIYSYPEVEAVVFNRTMQIIRAFIATDGLLSSCGQVGSPPPLRFSRITLVTVQSLPSTNS